MVRGMEGEDVTDLTCPLCHRTFDSKKKLIEHTRKHIRRVKEAAQPLLNLSYHNLPNDSILPVLMEDLRALDKAFK